MISLSPPLQCISLKKNHCSSADYPDIRSKRSDFYFGDAYHIRRVNIFHHFSFSGLSRYSPSLIFNPRNELSRTFSSKKLRNGKSLPVTELNILIFPFGKTKFIDRNSARCYRITEISEVLPHPIYTTRFFLQNQIYRHRKPPRNRSAAQYP